MKFHQCCHGCYKRHPKCHADCPDKAAEDAAYQEMKEQKAKTKSCMENQADKKEKINKKRRQHRKT